MQKIIRSYMLGDFVKKMVQEAIEGAPEGYVVSEHEVYKAGREYVGTLRIPQTEKYTLDSDVTVEPLITSSVAPTEPSKVLEGVPVDAKTVPDWKKLKDMVMRGDKDGIEAYCKPFGITLKKTKSPANMLKDFKDYVGA